MWICAFANNLDDYIAYDRVKTGFSNLDLNFLSFRLKSVCQIISRIKIIDADKIQS